MKQLQLFDTWEDDNIELIKYYQGQWKKSLWNKDVWYYQTHIGYTTYDTEHRNQYTGTMLPQKHHLCQDGNN